MGASAAPAEAFGTSVIDAYAQQGASPLSTAQSARVARAAAIPSESNEISACQYWLWLWLWRMNESANE